MDVVDALDWLEAWGDEPPDHAPKDWLEAMKALAAEVERLNALAEYAIKDAGWWRNHAEEMERRQYGRPSLRAQYLDHAFKDVPD